MACNHEMLLANWATDGDSIPGPAMPFCYECCHCHKTYHEIWMEDGKGYAEAVNEGRYPKECPIPLRRLTEADLKAIEQKQRSR